MADSFTENLNLTKPEVGSSLDTWGTKLNADMDSLDAVFAEDGSGTSVGLNVGSGKFFSLAGTLTAASAAVLNLYNATTTWVKANAFAILDSTDGTKAASFDLSGITTGTSRTLAVPDASGTIVLAGATQTLTSKTLTDCVGNTQSAADNSTKLATTAYADASSAAAVAGLSVWSTGDVKLTLNTTAPSGWLLMDDTTVGSASSAATHAGSQYQVLYSVLWAISDTWAPVTGGRGASASADWSANKPIALTKVLGRALAVAGAGSSLTSRALGQTLGEESHVMTTNELPAHTHSGGAALGNTTPSTGGGNVQGYATSNTGSAGSGAAFNLMQPTAFLNVLVKL